MKPLRYTLVADGSSDRVLLRILDWLLHIHKPDYAIEGAWADIRNYRHVPTTLAEKIRLSLELFPCEVLFIHRDAENQSPETRRQEINSALDEGTMHEVGIPVIPVRMMEAWLLIDEDSIRRAAGNPNGKSQLELPRLQDLESISDPKEMLYSILRNASQLTGRRLKKFSVHERVHRVAELMTDFSPLRQLAAFRALEQDIQNLDV